MKPQIAGRVCRQTIELRNNYSYFGKKNRGCSQLYHEQDTLLLILILFASPHKHEAIKKPAIAVCFFVLTTPVGQKKTPALTLRSALYMVAKTAIQDTGHLHRKTMGCAGPAWVSCLRKRVFYNTFRTNASGFLISLQTLAYLHRKKKHNNNTPT